MNYGFKEIGLAIIEQAVKDYRMLKRKGVSKLVFNTGGIISKSEIENFFHSEWCDFLLQNMKLTGEDILDYLDIE